MSSVNMYHSTILSNDFEDISDNDIFKDTNIQITLDPVHKLIITEKGELCNGTMNVCPICGSIFITEGYCLNGICDDCSS